MSESQGERDKQLFSEANSAPPQTVSEDLEVYDRIVGFRALEKDWDSYGAPPIQPGAIALALDLLAILSGTPHEITHASPTNDEAILLDTKSGMGIEVSIYGN